MKKVKTIQSKIFKAYFNLSILVKPPFDVHWVLWCHVLNPEKFKDGESIKGVTLNDIGLRIPQSYDKYILMNRKNKATVAHATHISTSDNPLSQKYFLLRNRIMLIDYISKNI